MFPCDLRHPCTNCGSPERCSWALNGSATCYSRSFKEANGYETFRMASETLEIYYVRERKLDPTAPSLANLEIYTERLKEAGPACLESLYPVACEAVAALLKSLLIDNLYARDEHEARAAAADAVKTLRSPILANALHMIEHSEYPEALSQSIAEWWMWQVEMGIEVRAQNKTLVQAN